MSKKSRDFYHIQDRIPLAWRYRTLNHWKSPDIDLLSGKINKLLKGLSASDPEVVEFIDLTTQKIELLEKALARASANQAPLEPADCPLRNDVEVSLSSSGVGFFSTKIAEEETSIELFLTLETLQTEVQMEATVLECRLSADSENPGYWIRVRFSRNQEQKIDKLLAHVTQRQIDKLNKKPDATPQS